MTCQCTLVVDGGYTALGTYCCKCATTQCFPAAANIKLENGTPVTMSELTVGDKVQTGIKIIDNVWTDKKRQEYRYKSFTIFQLKTKKKYETILGLRGGTTKV